MFDINYKKIVFVRHGQSEYNRDNKFYGWHDPDLTDLGRQQAQRVAGIIKDFIEPEIVICSDLKRAYNTAQPIAKVFGMEPVKFRDLREINNGEWEGITLEEAKEKFPEGAKKWLNNDKTYRFPGGENYEELYKRARNIFDEQVKKYDSLILVAHYGTIDSLLSGIFFGTPISQNSFVARNSTVIKFGLSEDGRALLYDFNA